MRQADLAGIDAVIALQAAHQRRFAGAGTAGEPEHPGPLPLLQGAGLLVEIEFRPVADGALQGITLRDLVERTERLE